MPSRTLWRSVLLGAMLAAVASAQQFQFQMRATSEGQTFVIANNSTLSFAATIGQTQTVQVTATYVGSGQVTVTQAPQVLGSTEFTANLSGMLPLTLTPNQSLSFSIQFQPTSSNQASAIFGLPFTETVPGVGSQGPTTNVNAITLSLIGSAASFVVSYTKDGNVIPLPNGGAIVFDPQPINTTVTLQVNITNTGSATGEVTGITLTGKNFKLTGTPLLPAGIPSAETLPIGVEYTPTAVASDTGQLQITFSDGTTFTASLQGSGISSTLVYTLIVNGKSTAVTPGGTITLPSTDVGQTSTATIRVQNTGAATATVTSVATAGAAFALGPVVLPKTLNTNDSFTFPITFAPVTPGVQTGELFVDNDSFTLSATGLGALLQFSYSVAGSMQVIGQNGNTAIVFSPLEITQSEAIPVTVTNTGTLATVISNIAIQENGSPYTVTDLSAKLPANLAPGASISFNVVFDPTVTGVSAGTLLVNAFGIPLTGSASTPPTLPSYTLSGPSGTVAPQSQPAVTLKLANPYPIAITGVLTLTTSGNLGTDTSVQFQTGGRTVDFTIPANSTTANFAGQGNQILLQSGTVAENITLTPSFATNSGVDLTPANPTKLQFSVAAVAPVLLIGVETASTTNAVTLSFTGYTTTRQLGSLIVQFTPAKGFNLSQSQVTVDLSGPAAIWFDSTTSQGFGGEFTVSIPFTFSGTVPKGDTLLQTIASFSATVTNSAGTSNAVSGPIQ